MKISYDVSVQCTAIKLRAVLRVLSVLHYSSLLLLLLFFIYRKGRVKAHNFDSFRLCLNMDSVCYEHKISLQNSFINLSDISLRWIFKRSCFCSAYLSPKWCRCVHSRKVEGKKRENVLGRTCLIFDVIFWRPFQYDL